MQPTPQNNETKRPKNEDDAHKVRSAILSDLVYDMSSAKKKMIKGKVSDDLQRSTVEAIAKNAKLTEIFGRHSIAIHHEDANTAIVIVPENEKLPVFVSFAGTNDLTDVKRDAAAALPWLNKHKQITPAGFTQAAESPSVIPAHAEVNASDASGEAVVVTTKVPEKTVTFMEKVMRSHDMPQTRRDGSARDIVISGHSLGGAIAQHAVNDRLMNKEIKDATAHTTLHSFCSPSVGYRMGGDIQKAFGANADQHCEHFYNKKDIVPRVGTGLFAGKSTAMNDDGTTVSSHRHPSAWTLLNIAENWVTSVFLLPGEVEAHSIKNMKAKMIAEYGMPEVAPEVQVQKEKPLELQRGDLVPLPPLPLDRSITPKGTATFRAP